MGFCDIGHGSGESQPGPAAMRRSGGNIGAIGLLRPLWFFPCTGGYQKDMLGVSHSGEGSTLLRAPVHLRRPALYTAKTEFTCNLNDMRSNMALQIGAVAPDFEAETTE